LLLLSGAWKRIFISSENQFRARLVMEINIRFHAPERSSNLVDDFVDELIEIEDRGDLLSGLLQLKQLFDLLELQVTGVEVIRAWYRGAGGHGSSQGSRFNTATYQNRCEAVYL